MNSMKRQKCMTLKDEILRSVLEKCGKITPETRKRRSQSENNSPVVDVTGDGSKVRCCKKQYCIETWIVRSMNQGKLEVIDRRWQE